MMKKIFLLTLASILGVGAWSQTSYDAATIAQRDLHGTARFVGMGGAMGALGGDISTITTNPAGIGVYRSNDIMFSLGYSTTGTESTYEGATFEANKGRWNFDNFGAVFSLKVGNLTPLRFVNFGFNYHKTKSFYRNMSMSGLMGQWDGVTMSQVRYMTQQGINNQAWLVSNGRQPLSYAGDDIYTNGDVGWLGAMAYQGWLNDDMPSSPYFLPYIPSDNVWSDFYSRERGGIDEYDFNISFNVKDRVYFGVTIGAHSVDYTKDTYYGERFDGDMGYDLGSWRRIHGSGFNAKFGLIVRPFEYSSFRVGLAVHTPTYYNLTYTNRAGLESWVNEEDYGPVLTHRISTYDALGGRDSEYDFNLRTPWVVNASLGYTVGSSLALGAEYEYENYRSMYLEYPDGYAMEHENDEMNYNLRGVHTLRVGAEWKVIPAFSLRAGYNYSTALYEKNGLKYMSDYTTATDTDFTNAYGQHTATLGLGYRWSSFYVDLAYKFETQKADFYPFFNELSFDESTDFTVTNYDDDFEVASPNPTKVTNTRSQVIFTIGYRF